MKHKLGYILSLLSSIITFGQVTLIAATEDKDLHQNQRFNLTIVLEISGENMVQETPLLMPDLSKFNIVGTASEQNTLIVDAQKGNRINQIIYQYALSPKQVGKIKIGSVLVTVNGKIYKTEPFDVMVKEAEKKSVIANNSDDIYLNLQVDDKEVFENQPTIAVLRAYSKDFDNFRKVKNIQFSPQQNLNVKPVSYQKSEIESHSGISSQVIAVFMIFPKESGKIEINPITATVANAENSNIIASNKVKINVKELPVGMPDSYKDAVGKFTVVMSHFTNSAFVEVGKPVKVRVKITGTGNLNSMEIPALKASVDYEFFKPKLEKNISTKENEMKGEIVEEYIVIPKKIGNLAIDLQDFVFFDPNNQEYKNLGKKSVVLNVLSPEQISDGKSTLDKVNEYTNNVLKTVDTPILKASDLKISQKNHTNWLVIVGNLLLVIATFTFFYFIKNRTKEFTKTDKNDSRNPIITIAETEKMIKDNLATDINDYFNYLKLLKENKDYTTFFSTYTDLETETIKQISANSTEDFKIFLEEKKGAKIAEEYRSLSQKIQMEKYAPIHTEEKIEELYDSIISVYSQISK